MLSLGLPFGETPTTQNLCPQILCEGAAGVTRSYSSVVQSKASESGLNETLQARGISKEYPKYFLGRGISTQAVHVACVHN